MSQYKIVTVMDVVEVYIVWKYAFFESYYYQHMKKADDNRDNREARLNRHSYKHWYGYSDATRLRIEK